jgi:hypothetical protein
MIDSGEQNQAIFLSDTGLQPGASAGKHRNRFHGFCRRGKPLKRLAVPSVGTTWLKPGVNEISKAVIHFA